MTVNGVTADVDEDGNWSADNVPIYGKGTATFDVVAVPSGSSSGSFRAMAMMSSSSSPSVPPVNKSTDLEFPARLAVSTYHFHNYWNVDDGSLWPSGDEYQKDFTQTWVRGTKDWQCVLQGTADDRGWDDDDTLHGPGGGDTTWQTVGKNHYEWDATSEKTITSSSVNGTWSSPITINHVDPAMKTSLESSEWGTEYYAEAKDCDWIIWIGLGYEEEEIDAVTELKLYTGGKAKVNRQNLFCIQASGTEYKGTPWSSRYGKTISPSQLRVLNKTPGSDGNLWIVEPDNASPDLLLNAPGKKHYYAQATQQKYYLVSRCSCPRQDFARTNVGVGEEVSVFFTSTMPYNIPSPTPSTLSVPITWKTTAGSISVTSSPSGTVLTSPSNAATATVTAAACGESLSIPFNVVEPSGISSTVRSNQSFFVGNVGAGMYLDVVLQPTNVSFGRVWMMEPSEATTGITGYFSNVNLSSISHANNGADEWHPVGCDNKIYSPPNNLFDHAGSYDWTGPFGSGGSYTWPIHPIWSVGTNGPTNSLSGWTDQVMTLSSDGTMRVDKLNLHVTRSP